MTSHAQPTHAGTTAATQTGTPNNTMAAVAYILTWITGLIVFFTAKKEDKFTRFHALQAIGLGVVVTVVQILWSFVIEALLFSSTTTGAASGFAAASLIGYAIWILTIVAVILCAVKAYKGSKFMLPLLGGIAEKNA